MQFAEKALIALSGESTRGAVFGQAGLKNIVKAGYTLHEAALQGAASPRFAGFTLGGLDPEETEDPADLPPPALRIDALWRGSIRIAASFPKAEITGLSEGRLSLDGLDASVAAANGGVLPTGAGLEAGRRAELVRRLAVLARHPRSATPEVIEAWLATAGAATVADLLEAEGTVPLSGLRIEISPPLGGGIFSQMDFPVAVAVLIRDPADPGMRLTEIVAATRRLEARLRKAGFEPKQHSEAGGQGKAVTALVVPEAWFDDTDWPGGTRAARITAAGAWMAREGIALVAAAL